MSDLLDRAAKVLEARTKGPWYVIPDAPLADNEGHEMPSSYAAIRSRTPLVLGIPNVDEMFKDHPPWVGYAKVKSAAAIALLGSTAEAWLAVARAAKVVDDEDRADGLPMRPRERVMHDAIAALDASLAAHFGVKP